MYNFIRLSISNLKQGEFCSLNMSLMRSTVPISISWETLGLVITSELSISGLIRIDINDSPQVGAVSSTSWPDHDSVIPSPRI